MHRFRFLLQLWTSEIYNPCVRLTSRHGMGVPVNQKQIFFVSGEKNFYPPVKLSMNQTPRIDPTKPIDMHVHVVGNGSGGSGCWLRVTGWHRPLAAMMLQHVGLPGSAMRGDMEGLLIARLLEMMRTSSLGAAVILAQDDVHDENGNVMPNVGSFYVPNDYVLGLAKKHREFLPAVSIHPARPDALEELDRCLAGGAVMMKCLPNCQNINCSDRRLTKFWERMAEAKLPLLGRHIPKCLAEPLAARMVHGSDFPVPVNGLWAWLRGFLSWKAYRQAQKTNNILERDYQLKVAMGFKPESFTRVAKLLRQP